MVWMFQVVVRTHTYTEWIRYDAVLGDPTSAGVDGGVLDYTSIACVVTFYGD